MLKGNESVYDTQEKTILECTIYAKFTINIIIYQNIIKCVVSLDEGKIHLKDLIIYLIHI